MSKKQLQLKRISYSVANRNCKQEDHRDASFGLLPSPLSHWPRRRPLPRPIPPSLRRPPRERFIARDIIWNCGAGACQGATDESRPLVLCQSLAKRAGKVDSFLVDGRAFTRRRARQLQRCREGRMPQRRSPPNKFPWGR